MHEQKYACEHTPRQQEARVAPTPIGRAMLAVMTATTMWHGARANCTGSFTALRNDADPWRAKYVGMAPPSSTYQKQVHFPSILDDIIELHQHRNTMQNELHKYVDKAREDPN